MKNGTVIFMVQNYISAVNSALLASAPISKAERERLRNMGKSLAEALQQPRVSISKAHAARRAKAAEQRANEQFTLFWPSTSIQEIIVGYAVLSARTGLSFNSLRCAISKGKGEFKRYMFDERGSVDIVTITRVNYAQGIGRPRRDELA
ncbi:MAG: hypothetical protein E6Q97_08085 [Desulfurellales bacterium]|nr:MAG: hypothetical protein E6Q97_08085 [Desulfurellales bacterium]